MTSIQPVTLAPTVTPTKTSVDTAKGDPSGVGNVLFNQKLKDKSADPPDFVDRMVELMDHEDPPAARLAIIAILNSWGVTKWSELDVFTGDEVVAAIDADPTSSTFKSLSKLLYKKRLGWIVLYARHGELTGNVSLRDCVCANTQQTDSSGTRHPSSSTVDKKVIPKIDHFSGLDEDWHNWCTKTNDTFGRAGLSRFLRDASYCQLHQEVAESVFFAIKQATNGGHGQSMANQMHSDKVFDPVKLWTDLETYYDTSINRANVVLFEIRRLLGLRLDPDTVPTKFISDFRASLLRLTENKATLIKDTDTLRALLLVAIQNDEFDTIRDDILKFPAKGIEDFLTSIRDRDSSLQIKDSGREISGDGIGNRYARRAPTNDQANSSTKWKIPFFPRSWQNNLDKNIFRLLDKWRQDAIRNNTPQWKLNNEYELTLDKYKKTLRNNNNRNQPAKRNARRARSDDQADGDDDDSPPDATQNSGRKREYKSIRLAHSGHVLFEQPSGTRE